MVLLQAAAQHLRSINITVQEPAGGMPEWERIIISAGVGALFSIIGSLIMEFVKPRIANRVLKKRIAVHLIQEVSGTLEAIEACRRAFDEVGDVRLSGSIAISYAGSRLEREIGEKYQHYFNAERVATYELDPQMLLRAFYGEVGYFRNSIEGLRAAIDPTTTIRTFSMMHATISAASTLGREALKELGAPTFTSHESAREQHHLGLIRAANKSESVP
ncbi:MAG: hypothetical protein WBE37_29000 [Bryobacteraceae bacterium]